MKKIVTPMNFVRGCEPRLKMDLLSTTKKQIELTNRYGIKTTYLLQYDAFVQEEYQRLFIPANDYKTTRVKFWKMVTDLFSKNYMKQIYDWCDARKLKITGHLP